jgi:hypothetical protein
MDLLSSLSTWVECAYVLFGSALYLSISVSPGPGLGQTC